MTKKPDLIDLVADLVAAIIVTGAILAFPFVVSAIGSLFHAG